MSFPRRQGFQQLSKEVMGVPRFPTNRSNQSQPQAPTVRALGTCSLRWKMSRVTSSSVQSQRNPFIKKATGAVHNASNPVSGWKSGLMPLSICDCLTGLEPSSPFAGRWVEASGRAASQGGQRAWLLFQGEVPGSICVPLFEVDDEVSPGAFLKQASAFGMGTPWTKYCQRCH
eukprot:8180880-Pyramimonas_sp.AAC.1